MAWRLPAVCGSNAWSGSICMARAPDAICRPEITRYCWGIATHTIASHAGLGVIRDHLQQMVFLRENMFESLMTRFRLAKEALSTAVAKDYRTAIEYFDQQLADTFQEILKITPTDRPSRLKLCKFLLDFCCANCNGELTNQAARKRLLELV